MENFLLKLVAEGKTKGLTVVCFDGKAQFYGELRCENEAEGLFAIRMQAKDPNNPRAPLEFMDSFFHGKDACNVMMKVDQPIISVASNFNLVP